MNTEKNPGSEMKQGLSVEELLAQLPTTGDTDTVFALMEVYESVEQSYRAAIMTGEARPGVAQSTNF